MNSYQKLKRKLEDQRERHIRDIDKILNHPDEDETKRLIKGYKWIISIEQVFSSPITHKEMIAKYGCGFSDKSFMELLKDAESRV